MTRLVRRRVIVHGRVQGVFFRDSVRERAVARGLRGRVRNLPDGTVEAVFEGASDAVAALISFCETGPRGADVERVEVIEEEMEGVDGFEVR